MIRINQLKLPIHHTPEELTGKAAKLLRIQPSAIKSLHIVKQSLDARKRQELLFIYTVDVEADWEEELVQR
ncbi:MAG: FAD-dependent oxidoreductase, partial [Hungatella sp.]